MDRLFASVPFFFTDLIARLIPGGVALWAYSTALNINMFQVVSDALKDVSGLHDSGLFKISLIVALAYLLGLMIDPIAGQLGGWIEEKCPALSPRLSTGLLQKAIEGKDTRYTTAIGKYYDDEVKRLGGDTHNIAIFLFYDWLTIYVSESGKRAAKFNAEYLMCRAIYLIAVSALLLHLLAWLVTHSVGSYFGWQQVDPCIPFIVLGSVGAGMAFLGMKNKSEAFEQHVLNHYFVAQNFPKWVGTANAPTPDAN